MWIKSFFRRNTKIGQNRISKTGFANPTDWCVTRFYHNLDEFLICFYVKNVRITATDNSDTKIIVYYIKKWSFMEGISVIKEKTNKQLKQIQ